MEYHVYIDIDDNKMLCKAAFVAHASLLDLLPTYCRLHGPIEIRSVVKAIIISVLCYDATACANSVAVGEAGAGADSMRALVPSHASDTAQLYSPLSPVAITPSRSSFL